MRRKTRWTTRFIIIIVLLFTFYMGWHLTKAIQVYKEEANTLDYIEEGRGRR